MWVQGTCWGRGFRVGGWGFGISSLGAGGGWGGVVCMGFVGHFAWVWGCVVFIEVVLLG